MKFLVIIIASYFLGLIYSTLVYLKTKSINEFVYRMVFIVFLPPIGVFYVIFVNKKLKTQLNKKNWFLKNDKILSYHDMQVQSSIEELDEIDIVPMEEALFINSRKQKRNLVTKIIKENPEKYINVLRLALNDKDTETSHFAASVITEIKRKSEENIRKYILKKDKFSYPELNEFKVSIKNHIDCSFDKNSERKYQSMLSQLLEEMIDEKYSSEVIEEKIDCDLKNGNYKKAKNYCLKYLKISQNSEKSLIKYLKFAYVTNNSILFNKILFDINKTRGNLSENTKNIINLFTSDENNIKQVI